MSGEETLLAFFQLLSIVHGMKQARHVYLSDGKGCASKRDKLCQYDGDYIVVINRGGVLEGVFFKLSQHYAFIRHWWKFLINLWMGHISDISVDRYS